MAEGVMRRRPLAQVQIPGQPLFLALAKGGYLAPVIRPGDDRTQSNGHDVDQWMCHQTRDAGVLDALEMFIDRCRRLDAHWYPPHLHIDDRIPPPCPSSYFGMR